MNQTKRSEMHYDGVEWLLERLPESPRFIELFGDVASIGISRKPRGVDTINDHTHDVRAFFAAVRDYESELIERLENATSEEILSASPRSPQLDSTLDLLEEDATSTELDPTLDPDALIDRAAAFFIRAGGLNPVRSLASTPGRWAFHVEESDSLSRPTSNESLLTRIHDVADRLRRIQIDHEPLEDVFDRHDGEDALFFGVPPVALTESPEGETFFSMIEDLEGNLAVLVPSDDAEEFTSRTGWSSAEVPAECALPFADKERVLCCNFEIEPSSIEFDPYTEHTETQAQLGQFSGEQEQTAEGPSPPGGSPSIRGGKLLPFRWYGGKFTHLKWLLPLLPEADTFVEPFGGSGAVLINRDPSPKEVYNDIDPEVTTFLRVLKGINPADSDSRDATIPANLLRQIALTPFSRGELAMAVAKYREEESLSNMERSRLFFTRAGQTRSGLAQEASAGRWAYCKSTSRRTMSGAVSRWHGRLDHLYATSERLDTVEIRNQDALEVIEEFGSDPSTLIYCDPPYPHESRGDTNSYGFELANEQHRELANVLKECEAKVALSSYKSDLYAELYGEDDEWHRFDSEEQTMHTTKDSRVESVWMNYDPPTDADG